MFTIDPGILLGSPDETKSGFFTTALSGANAANDLSPGPLMLELGAVGSGGRAPLRLSGDATISIVFIDGTCLCVKLLGAGSDGSIDCDGGTAYDTYARATSNSNWDLETGLGTPAGPGDGDLLVTGVFAKVMTDCEVADCRHRHYANAPRLFAFTTTSVRAEANVSPTLDVQGQPFDCASFGIPRSGGMLAAPMPFSFAPVGDASNVIRLGEASFPRLPGLVE